jgi:hypothetical protein
VGKKQVPKTPRNQNHHAYSVTSCMSAKQVL